MRILFLIIFWQTLCFSQQNGAFTDSIFKEIASEKNNLKKARLYRTLAVNYQESDSKKAIIYANQGLVFAKKVKLNRAIGVFNSLLGEIYHQNGNFPRALNYYNKSYAINKLDNDLDNLASTNNNLGNLYLSYYQYDKAISRFNEALQIAEKTKNNSLKATCLSNIGIVFSEQNNFEKAIAYYKKSSEISKKTADLDNYAKTILHIANLNTKQSDTISAKKNYIYALNYFKKNTNLVQIATVYQNLSIIENNEKLNLRYKLEAQEIWNKISPENQLSITNLGNISYQYLYLAKIKKINKKLFLDLSENYLNQALSLINKKENIGQFAFLKGIQSELDAEKGNFQEAYKAIKIHYETNDSIFSQENKNKIAKIESQKEIDLKNKEIQLNVFKLKEKEKQKWFYISGIFLIGIIGCLVYLQSRNRQKINKKLQILNKNLDLKNIELDEANKAKTRFFSVINHDLRSPVSNLIDFLHIQRDSPELLDEEIKTRIEKTTLTSVENLLTSMEDILQWSKSQMENFKPQPKVIAISTLFEEIKNHFSSEEKIKIVFENLSDIEINTDENYLKTIIRNLTGNAIKSLIDIENPTIIWKFWQENDTFHLSITDNGKGASNEQFKALYDDKEVVGIKTGLGLHLIRDLAKAINCEITVNSQINKGTTFILSL